MKVAIVHDFLMKLGGAERVVKAFADMYPNAPIYTMLYDEEAVGKVFPKERVRTSFLQKYPKFIRDRYRFLVPKMPKAIEELNFEGFDLVISSNTAFSHGIVTPLNTKHVCYCHSPMRYAWDWVNEYQQEHHISGLKKLIYAPMMKSLREWDKVASDRVGLYLANSKNVQKRIKKYYKMDSVIVYPPVDTERFTTSRDHAGYFLIVSTLTPYKKIDLAVQLFNKIGRKLVIIGDGPHKEYLQNIAADNIEFLGFKDDATVVEYMKNCRALIFPGEEDFGITPVEAMACGKPVLAYAKGGVMETMIEGQTGEFFYEPTVESMEDGLSRLMYNEKFYKPRSIRLHSQQFSREIFEKNFKQALKLC
jgi:glycosyltransferase involved in cell wall biosynthesis